MQPVHSSHSHSSFSEDKDLQLNELSNIPGGYGYSATNGFQMLRKQFATEGIGHRAETKGKAKPKENMEKIKKAGLQVLPWTVNQPEDIALMMDLGVDGIITDFPERVPKK